MYPKYTILIKTCLQSLGLVYKDFLTFFHVYQKEAQKSHCCD